MDFDLPHLLNNLCRASNSFKLHLSSPRESSSNPREKSSKDPKKQAKDTYEFSFNKII